MNTIKIALYNNHDNETDAAAYHAMTPTQTINEMFEYTDENGTLYIPAWPYDGVYDEKVYRCVMDWDQSDRDALVKEHAVLTSALAQLAERMDSIYAAEDARTLPEDLQAVWDTYICDFETSDIDLEKKQLLEHGAKARNNENKDRVVPICDPLIPFLENIKNGQHVIYDSTGRPLSNDTRRNKWRSFVRAINIEMGAPMANNKILDPYFDKEVTAYYLRHTFNVDCVSAKVPWIIKEQFMGHSLKKKTLGYDHLTDRNIEIGRQLLNEFHICNLGKVEIDRLNNYAEKNCIIPRR